MITQTDLRTAILDPERPVPAGLSDGHGKPAGKRFAVYRNNVAVSLTEALITAFPSIHALVGDQFFRAMAGVFLRQHPPSSPMMMHYGADMPGFLAGFEPVAHLPYLPDVARIDLGLRHAYHAADATPIDPQALGRIAPEHLGDTLLALAPATQVVTSPYAIHDIWQMHRGGPKPGQAAQDVLITRPEYDPVTDTLPQGAAAVLQALMAGEALQSALDHAPDGFDLGALLALLLGRGAIVGVQAPN
ncbi:MAG: DNA-binding domain-containing protein [Pseudomonadota bacterium]